jgi:hypothetical protein
MEFLIFLIKGKSLLGIVSQNSLAISAILLKKICYITLHSYVLQRNRHQDVSPPTGDVFIVHNLLR